MKKMTWRDDVKGAALALSSASEAGSSWLELLVAEQNLKTAKEAISSAITRLNCMKTVSEAKKHVNVRPVEARR
jgi:hypothetical protein